MKKFYTILSILILLAGFNQKSLAQSVTATYQFFHDINNNCNLDAGEEFIYNLPGYLNLNYVDVSSSTNTVSVPVSCSPLSVTNPSVPATNTLTYLPFTILQSFSINPACTSYKNLPYTGTTYLPLKNINPYGPATYYTNMTGYYTSTVTSVFPICNNAPNDSVILNFDISNLYTCGNPGDMTASRTYSIYFDNTLIDQTVVTSTIGSSYQNGSMGMMFFAESYSTLSTSIYVKTKLTSGTLSLGNHSFELRSTPIYTNPLSAISYSIAMNSVPCSIISGNVYADCDNNCVVSAGDLGISSAAYVKVYDATNTFNIYAASNGSFTGMVPASSTQYSITSIPVSVNYTPCASATQTYVVPNTATTPYNFEYKGTGNPDPDVLPHGMPLTPVAGGIFKPYVYLNNYGYYSCATSSVNPGKLKILMDKNFTYQSPVSPTTAPNFIVPGPAGDTLIWNVPDFNTAVGSGLYCVQVAISNTITNGTVFQIKAFITPQFDINTSNNQATDYGTIGSPFDPNGKRCYSNGMAANGDIPFGNQDLYYLVEFQNVGTASATNVRTIDTLDSNLDWTTLNVIGSSFPVQTQVDQVSGQTIFYFNNINLPDSTMNGPGSHGFVYYHIKLKPSVPVSTIIKNRAHNYFDFQPPVPTNQTKNKLVIFSGINELSDNKSIFIAPNPVSDKITISSKEIIQTVSVFNNLGQIVMKQDVNAIQSQIDLSQTTDGIYFIQVQFKDSVKATRKVVKN